MMTKDVLTKWGYFALIAILGYSVLLAAPKIQVNPAEVTAGSYQTMTFTFFPDTTTILAGGGFRIELPVAYLETGPYYWDAAQTELPDGRGFVSSTTTKITPTKTLIYGNKDGVIECQAKEELASGENLTIQYSGIVQSLGWPLKLRAQWRRSAEESWRSFHEVPVIRIKPLNAKVLLAVIPADIQWKKPFELLVVLLDTYGNQASRYAGEISFSSTDPEAKLPKRYTFTEQDSGRHLFTGIRFATEGFQQILVTDGLLEGESNYAMVTREAPAFRRYFGDTHFHTGTGMDHKGFTERGAGGDHRGHFTSSVFAYQYARNVMGLDFASSAEHDARYFDENLWAKSQDIADDYYQPGSFTTFYAYEWTATAKVGHNVVMYKDRAGRVLDHFDYPSKPELWAAFDRQNVPVIMIPHPMWAQPDHEMWNEINNHYRPIGEIYSLWCTRFLLQPAVDAQRFELGPDDRWSFQYAWSKGHRVEVIGSSDNHTAHPGMNNYTTDMVHSAGLAAVLAGQNNREELWQGLQSRRTYATTGTRIWVDFKSDGRPMGSAYSSSQSPRLSARVAGTNTLASVEIVKFNGKAYSVLYRVNPDADTVEFDVVDEDFENDSMYYLRVKQVNEIWKSPWAYGTAEMAWSSPIWVDKAK